MQCLPKLIEKRMLKKIKKEDNQLTLDEKKYWFNLKPTNIWEYPLFEHEIDDLLLEMY